MQANGYTVASSRLFASRWKDAVRRYGEVYNPTTGKLTKSFQLALAQTVKDLTEEANIDAVVFTDLLEREVQFSGGTNHLAKWDGVSSKPSLQGAGAAGGATVLRPVDDDRSQMWLPMGANSIQTAIVTVAALSDEQMPMSMYDNKENNQDNNKDNKDNKNNKAAALGGKSRDSRRGGKKGNTDGSS